MQVSASITARFQHTAARRRLGLFVKYEKTKSYVSTHSRPKAAGWQATTPKRTRPSFNTQPPEGGWFISFLTFVALKTFQHTAARRRLAWSRRGDACLWYVSTHSRPKAAGYYSCGIFYFRDGFQHTAARRRLDTDYIPALHTTISFNTQPPEGGWGFVSKQERAFLVSTHSRPKAAGLMSWILF